MEDEDIIYFANLLFIKNICRDIDCDRDAGDVGGVLHASGAFQKTKSLLIR